MTVKTLALRFTIIISLSMILGNALFAQQKAGTLFDLHKFAGKWSLDEKRSDFGPNNAKEYRNTYWSINVNGDEITIGKHYEPGSRLRSYELKLLANNEGEENIVPEYNRNTSFSVRSRTLIKKNRLLRRYNTNSEPIAIESSTKEQFYLSNDGSLIFESVSSIPGISPTPSTFKLVFNRMN